MHGSNIHLASDSFDGVWQCLSAKWIIQLIKRFEHLPAFADVMTVYMGVTLRCSSLTKSNSLCGVQGNINLIEAAAKKGVKRFILLTSIGVGDSKDAPPQQVYDVLKPVLIEKGKAEEKLKVRPGPAAMHALY